MRFIDQPAGLERMAAELEGAQRLFVDTEFESNRSGTRMCLLQVTAGEEIYLVDTLKLGALDPLREIFGAASTEWVLHAGLQDVQLITERLRISSPELLFDTQVAWALLGPESSVSLAYLQFRLLGRRGSKAHQADDWMRRPLPKTQLEYAAADVRHLPDLRRQLGALAQERGRRETIIHQASSELLHPVQEPPAPLSLASFRNAWQLEPAQQAGLRHVIDWYNGLSAAERDFAPETKTLLAIASRLPESPEALSRIKGVPRQFAARNGWSLVEGLARAVAGARSEDFVPIDPAPYATFEEIRLDAWLGLARAEVCADVGAAPELLLPGRILKAMRAALLQKRTPLAALDSVSGWRRELLEPAFERFCQSSPPPL